MLLPPRRPIQLQQDCNMCIDTTLHEYPSRRHTVAQVASKRLASDRIVFIPVSTCSTHAMCRINTNPQPHSLLLSVHHETATARQLTR
eukprot:1223832-Pleurochrysis_carterae.AAC.3